MSDAETRYSTEEAAAYLGVSIRTLDNYQKAGRLTPGYDAETGREWKKEDLDAVRASWPHGKKPPGRPPKETQRAETFATNLLKVTKGRSPHEVLTELQLPPGASMRQITAALQRRIADLVIQHRVIEVVVADLSNPDAKARRAAAETLLAKVVPNLKAVQMEHTIEESTTHRQERALKVLEEIAAQGRNRQLNHTVRVIEPEDTEIVEDE